MCYDARMSTTPDGKKVGQWITSERRTAIYERDGWECVYCGQGPRTRIKPAPGVGVLTLDHLTPRTFGGSNKSENLVTACVACNCSRQEKPWREFATGGAIARIEYLVEQPVDLELGKAIWASLKGHPVEATR
jgi:hypothetical protein